MKRPDIATIKGRAAVLGNTDGFDDVEELWAWVLHLEAEAERVRTVIDHQKCDHLNSSLGRRSRCSDMHPSSHGLCPACYVRVSTRREETT